MHRRTFIMRSGSTLAAATAPVLSPMTATAVVNSALAETQTAQQISNSAIKHFTKADWQLIATLQNHLFPSETDAPGAVEINALKYLHDFLRNPATDPIEVEFIHSGTQKLQKFAQQRSSSGQTAFTDQSIEQREITLREFEQQPEQRRWLVTILNYVLEALLTDPVYGGNPDGIGWQWLEHRAGEPRPPMNKRYWLL